MLEDGPGSRVWDHSTNIPDLNSFLKFDGDPKFHIPSYSRSVVKAWSLEEQQEVESVLV